jgi:iron complex outermembrane receptor protein
MRAKLPKAGNLTSNTFVKIEYNYHWSQRHVLLENHTETFTPGYTLWNAGAGTDFVTRRGETWLSLYLSVNNIFDVACQSYMSRLKYAAANPQTGRTGVFNMGRNVSLKVVIPVVFRKKD